MVYAQEQVPSKPTTANLSDLKELAVGRQFTAKDTIQFGQESNEDAAECLKGLSWLPSEFTVSLEDGQTDRRFERLVRFPSPVPLGDPTGDLVAMEWYVAMGKDGKPIKAPAVVVVHESGSQMTAGRLIALGFRAHGVHAFMVQMPGYGVRKNSPERDYQTLIQSMKQAVADVRRARDAVAALPLVDDSMIGIQGTSLGGFVTATVGGLDRAYDRVFILLAGGDLNRVIFEGAKDAAAVRNALLSAGLSEAKIREGIRHVEPLRLAHRLRPNVTWLWSGKFDDVVPPECARALAQAAKLSTEHHIELPVDHYSGAILIPKIVYEMSHSMTVE